MNKELPTESQIFSAERKRTKGLVAQAAEEMRPAVEYPLDDFTVLENQEKQRLLMASRIYVVAKTSEANRAWEAPTVAHHLGQAKEALDDVYRNPYVQEAGIPA